MVTLAHVLVGGADGGGVGVRSPGRRQISGGGGGGRLAGLSALSFSSSSNFWLRMAQRSAGAPCVVPQSPTPPGLTLSGFLVI